MNRADRDYAFLREKVELSYRETLDLRSLISRAFEKLDEIDKKLGMIDVIHGFQATLDEAARSVVSKCSSLSQKHELLEKSVKTARDEGEERNKKVQEYQNSFKDLKEQFVSLRTETKLQMNYLQTFYSNCLEDMKKECKSNSLSLAEKLSVSPKQVWDQNEEHNAKLSRILEQTTATNDETKKMKVWIRVLENTIDTIRKKVG
jgi:chromosome segregation ATPase